MEIPTAIQKEIKAIEDAISAAATEPETVVTHEPEAVQATPEPETEGTLSKLRTDNTRLENANKVLQGKYNAEVPRLHKTVEELQKQLAELKQQKAVEIEPELTESQREYGEELWDGAARVARAEVQKALKQLEEKFGAVEARVKTTTVDTFFSQLDTLLPDWEAIDRSQAFQTWASKYVPLMGMSYLDRLDIASNQGDAKGASEVYLEFRRQTGHKVDVASQVVPGRGAAMEGDASERKGKTWTIQEWEAEMTKLTFAQLPPREYEQKLKILTEAMQNGWVR